MNVHPEEAPCWLVWEKALDGGRPYLVAIDTTEEQARLHERATLDAARVQGRSTMVQIEESKLNHLYGQTMGQAFDEARAMLRERRRGGGNL